LKVMEALGWTQTSSITVANTNAISVLVGEIIVGATVFGTLNILLDAGASGTTIGLGGTENVYGFDDATIVNDGGYQYVFAGGIAKDTTLNDPGVQIVLSGGTAIDAVLDGGEQDVFGTASGTVVNSGGLQVIEGGGSAIGTTVGRGGTVEVKNGGILSGIDFAGRTATLKLDAPAAFGSTITGLAIGDIIDLVNTSVTSATVSNSILTITEKGGLTIQYTLAGFQPGIEFGVQDDKSGGTDLVVLPAVSFIGPVVHAAADKNWPVTVSGLSGETGALTFTDIAGHSVSLKVTGNGTYLADLSSLVTVPLLRRYPSPIRLATTGTWPEAH
jgi:autotransporter passenger strand-loop-strand repeat protein